MSLELLDLLVIGTYGIRMTATIPRKSFATQAMNSAQVKVIYYHIASSKKKWASIFKISHTIATMFSKSKNFDIFMSLTYQLQKDDSMVRSNR